MISNPRDYRSNLEAPDLRPNFRHMEWKSMPHAMGHMQGTDYTDYPDDHPVFGLYKRAGSCTLDEAAILYHCVKRSDYSAIWLEIGSLFGFSTSYICAASESTSRYTWAIDNMFPIEEFRNRFRLNTKPYLRYLSMFPIRSDELFADASIHYQGLKIGGAFIDGDHDRPRPMEDALNCAKYAADDAVILMHDAWGAPVLEAVLELINRGWKCRFYDTPHGLACLFRGIYQPPDHTPDPLIAWEYVRQARANWFPWGKCV